MYSDTFVIYVLCNIIDQVFIGILLIIVIAGDYLAIIVDISPHIC